MHQQLATRQPRDQARVQVDVVIGLAACHRNRRQQHRLDRRLSHHQLHTRPDGAFDRVRLDWRATRPFDLRQCGANVALVVDQHQRESVGLAHEPQALGAFDARGCSDCHQLVSHRTSTMKNAITTRQLQIQWSLSLSFTRLSHRQPTLALTTLAPMASKASTATSRALDASFISTAS